MKHTTLVTVLVILLSNASNSQVLSGDASGNSSVLYHGIGLGFKIDAKAPAITFALNNFNNEKLKNEKDGFVWGLNAISKSEDGIARIFSSGDIASSFKGGFIAGYSWKSEALSQKFQSYIARLQAMNGSSNFSASSVTGANKFDALSPQQIEQAKNFRGYWKRRQVVFADIAYTTSAFKRFLGVDPIDYSKSFGDELFRGYHALVGYNHHFEQEEGERWLIGFKTGVQFENNLSSLNAKDYTLRTTNTTGNQQLITEKKITAYPGNYQETITYPVLFDVVYFSRIADSIQLGVNGYIHHRFSKDKVKLPQTTDVGISLNFFKEERSKFLGGIYVELPDLQNNITRNDPEATIRSPLKRLTFGIVAKYTFNSLFGY